MILKELKNWLKGSNYPGDIINHSFYNVRLHDPIPSKDKSKKIPFITTYY